MKLYVAGPMSHLPDNNRPAFAEAARLLREAGYEVINPAEQHSETFAFANQMGAAFRDTSEYRRIIAKDLEFVASVEGVAVLDGWETSSGAKAEVAYAQCLGHEIKPVRDWLDSPTDPVGVVHLKWTGDPELGPTAHYDGDAGWDLYVSETTAIHYDQFVDVPLGISVEMPEGYWAMLTGRSSTLRARGLLVTQGIIDNGFRGPLYAGTRNMASHTVIVERGERIAQLIPFRLGTPGIDVFRVDELTPSDRGVAGFGSTGT